jgi:hypothetical protein
MISDLVFVQKCCSAGEIGRNCLKRLDCCPLNFTNFALFEVQTPMRERELPLYFPKRTVRVPVLVCRFSEFAVDPVGRSVGAALLGRAALHLRGHPRALHRWAL